MMTLTTTPGATGARVLFYIDGNLWVHNPKSMSLSFASVGSQGTQVTFVVKGNIYFSDNIFMQNQQRDAVAFIALRDSAVQDSGNIYFGDPRFGTLEYMHAYMYAENNFYDHQLDATGSQSVEVVGTMAAGNHIAINRDYGQSHCKLGVTMDPRLRDGLIDLPGLPGQTQELTYEIIAWVEVNKNR
jgi:hypothetical protein